MKMRSLEDLREMMCEELDKIAEKNSLSASDVHSTYEMLSSISLIDEQIEMEEGYSGDGDWHASGTYGRDRSHAGGRHYVRGHYSRDGYPMDSSYEDGVGRIRENRPRMRGDY